MNPWRARGTLAGCTQPIAPNRTLSPRGRVKILFVSPWYPWPPDTAGAHQRIFHLVAGMARNHDVTLVALSPDGAPEGQDAGDSRDPLPTICERVIRVSDAHCRFRVYGAMSEAARYRATMRAMVTSRLAATVGLWRSPDLARVLRELRGGPYDVAWAERTWIAEQVRDAGFAPIVVDLDDVESIAFSRWLAQRPFDKWTPLLLAELVKTRLYEQRIPQRFKVATVCKNTDRDVFGPMRSRIAVLPNGVELSTMPVAASELDGEVLFVGNLASPPNVDAVLYFAREILPELRRLHPAVRFTIAGRMPPPDVRALHDGARCLVTGAVPDLDRFYAAASVVVVPIRTGGGTRIKLLDALGHGKAVVATTVGAEGLDLRPGTDLLLADDAAAFARECARLMKDAALRRRLGESGRARVLGLYSWQRVEEKAEMILREISAR